MQWRGRVSEGVVAHPFAAAGGDHDRVAGHRARGAVPVGGTPALHGPGLQRHELVAEHAGANPTLQGRVDALTWATGGLAGILSGIVFSAAGYRAVALLALTLLAMPLLGLVRVLHARAAGGPPAR